MRGKTFRPRPVRTTSPDGMNKTEREYADRLERQRLAGEICAWRFEPFNFRLANRTYYRPDFLVVCAGHFEIHEVKGFWQDDALVKIKVAAEMHPWFVWRAVQYKQKQWTERTF